MIKVIGAKVHFRMTVAVVNILILWRQVLRLLRTRGDAVPNPHPNAILIAFLRTASGIVIGKEVQQESVGKN